MGNKKYENFGADFICAMGDVLRAQREDTAYSAKEKARCELEAYKAADAEIRALEKDPRVLLALHEKELRARQVERLRELRALKRRGELLAELGWEVPEDA